MKPALRSLLLLPACLLSIPAIADSESPVDDLGQQIMQLRARQMEESRQLELLEQRYNELRRKVPPTAAEKASASAAPTAAGQNQNAAGSPHVLAMPATQDTQQSATVAGDSRFSLETGLSYAHYDRKQLQLNGFLAMGAVFLGNINVNNVKADTLTLDLTGRYKLSDRLQLDLDAPFLYRSVLYETPGAGGDASAVTDQRVTDPMRLGDITMGGYYTLWHETNQRPELVANLHVRAPTGTSPYGIQQVQNPNNNNMSVPAELASGNGLWQLSGGLAVSKTLDPAVVFANVNYYHNFSRHFANISSTGTAPGDVELGDSIQYGLGAAYALNERFSLTTAFTERLTARSRTRQDGYGWTDVPASDANAAVLSLGGTYALDKKAAVSVMLGAGLTPDAPNTQLSVRYNHSF